MSERGKSATELSEAQWEEKFRKARDLLQKGEVSDAVIVLEQLRDAKPQERVARTLLAMAYSRCDRWDDAETMYRELIKDFPDEILLRVRLATLYMQLERDTEALRWLEEIADTAPESKELHSTLGVIYMRLGQYKKARAAFEVTGEETLLQALEARTKEDGWTDEEVAVEDSDESLLASTDVDSMESIRILADDFPISIHEAVTAEHDAPTATAKDLWPSRAEDGEDMEDAISVVVLPPPEGGDPESQEHLLPALEDVPFVMSPTELETTKFPGGPMPMGLSRGEKTTPLWIDFAQLFGDADREFMLLNDGRLLVWSQDKTFVRLRDLSLMNGQPKMFTEQKRFQGKSVGQTFGPRDNPMIRLEGQCQLLLQAQKEGHRSSVLLANGQVAYFREGVVLAFSSAIDWENGRVPAGVEVDSVGDLALDQFWGQGEIILQSDGPVWGIPARAGAPVRVAYENLLGWVGELVPQIIHRKHVAKASNSVAFVEFEGEGGVLISS